MSETNHLPPNLMEAFPKLIDRLDSLKIQFCVVGGISIAARGIPRDTFDIDFLLSIPSFTLGPLMDRLVESGFTLDGPTAIRDFRKHLARIYYKDVPIDLMGTPIPFLIDVIKRSLPTPLLGLSVPIPTPEDLIAMKLAAFRNRDQDDIKGILAVQAGKMDLKNLLTACRHLVPDRDPRLDTLRQWYADFCTRQ